MDPILLESPAMAKSPGFGRLAGGAYESLLKDSIDRFLGEIRKGTCDLSGFHSVFFRLLQSRADPQLEVVWFYSAVSYYENFSSAKEVLGRVFAVRDLLQLLAACSVSCSGQKSIALLAPVVYELQRIMLDVEKPCEEFSTKELRKLRKEIYLLVEGVSSYISICSSRNCDGNGASDCLVPCFVDLVRIWTARRTDGGDALQEFFPFVNEEIRNALAKSGCQVRYLSGVVIAEVFLLMLRLKLQKTGGSSPELRSELKVWAVGSITGFKSLDFFEILLVLLLNGDLPSSLLVNPVDEAFLRDIIYDSVVSVEYSFLYPEREADNFSVENLDVARLIVTHQAIRAARGRGDQAKLTAYLNAFSRSALRSSLTKLITDRVGAEKLVGKNAASPESLLKWLLNLEDRGYKVHNFDLSRLQSKLLFDEPKASTVARPSESNRKEDGDIFFFDSKGGSSAEEETNDQEVEMMDDVFLSAARNMKSAPGDGRKRKGSKEGGERDIARFIRYKLHNHTAKDIPAPSKAAGEISGESDVENPPSDEEMEDSD